MKRFLISSLLLVPLTSFAQAPPVIQRVTPSAGPTAGGTEVTIAGDHLSLPPNFACLLPCPTRVTFGGAQAMLLQESETLLAVKIQPHSPGVVDVMVRTGDGRSVTAPGAFVYSDSDEAGYQRVLLPIYLEQPSPGSNGSSWNTRLWLRNEGTDPITLAPWVCPRGALCVPVFPLTRQLQAHETMLNLPAIDQTNIGRLLYVNQGGLDDLSAGLRLYETSRGDEDAGTEIPVVRESGFLNKAAHFHGVPLDSRFRVMLRVYEMDAPEAQFRVGVFEESEGVSDGSPVAQFTLNTTAPDSGPFGQHPGYAGLGSFLFLPAGVRIDVEPLTPGSRYWALVSVTSNTTQRVTLVTPQ